MKAVYYSTFLCRQKRGELIAGLPGDKYYDLSPVSPKRGPNILIKHMNLNVQVPRDSMTILSNKVDISVTPGPITLFQDCKIRPIDLTKKSKMGRSRKVHPVWQHVVSEKLSVILTENGNLHFVFDELVKKATPIRVGKRIAGSLIVGEPLTFVTAVPFRRDDGVMIWYKEETVVITTYFQEIGQDFYEVYGAIKSVNGDTVYARSYIQV